MCGKTFEHKPIMLNESIGGLNVKESGIYVDCTTGAGGHSAEIAKRLKSGRLICIDKDDDALAAAEQRLAEYADKISFIHDDFKYIKGSLRSLEIERVDGILLDLGVSSYQLDEASRGFSYMQDAPLDMRMDKQSIETAADIVNSYSGEMLRNIIKNYGEEKFAGSISTAIVKAREKKRIETTLELVEIIKKAIPVKAAKTEKQHPAKRTFQALRICTNDELGAIEKCLEDSLDLLGDGGRVCVISFHSLEDKIVKSFLQKSENNCICNPSFPKCVCGFVQKMKVITKKPIIASEAEIKANPRARSAKLRIGEKMNSHS